MCRNLCSLSALLANRCWKRGGTGNLSVETAGKGTLQESSHSYNLVGALLSPILHVINAREGIHEKSSMKSCLICPAVESWFFFWRALVIPTSPLTEQALSNVLVFCRSILKSNSSHRAFWQALGMLFAMSRLVSKPRD